MFILGKKGGPKHLKRYAAPKYWPIHRKEKKFTVRAFPGPHQLEYCIPLLVLIRDVLQLGQTAKEGKTIIYEGNIKVDGKIRKNYKFPVGLMDVVEIPSINKIYRIIPFKRKGLSPFQIIEDEKNFKLCKIINKTLLKDGRTQLNLHDGRNIIIPSLDVPYKTRDVLKISIPDQKILEHYPIIEETPTLVTAGRHMGEYGTLKKIERQTDIVTLEHEGNTFQTALKYAFIIGKTKPSISLFEKA